MWRDMTEDSLKHGTIAVIGLGYIGLPTAIVFAESGWRVIGVDVAERTVDTINSGRLPFVEEGLEKALQTVIQDRSFSAQTGMPTADVYIISVPTPFLENHQADLSHIDSACDSIAPVLTGGELIVLESTSPPGTTQRLASRILAARPDLSLDENSGKATVYFAHAPERVLPGRILAEMRTNDRVVGGVTPKAGDLAKELYQTACHGEVSVADAKTAELVKLTENAFRDLNIAFANELSMIAQNIGVDVWELISLANRHPRVNILQPGPGVGGHCIAVDPWFIVSSDPENSTLIRTARTVNDSKPNWVMDSAKEAINQAGPEAKIALLGLSFKPNIDDLRESPALAISRALVQQHPDSRFLVSEPHVDHLPTGLGDASNVESVPAKHAVQEAAVVVLLVDHDAFKAIPVSLLEDKTLIDTRGFWADRKATLNGGTLG